MSNLEEMQNQVFEKERFMKMGIENDFRLQAIIWISEASQKLSLARTVLTDCNVMEQDQLQQLAKIQSEVHEFKDLLREK